jgi:nitrite reductase/ring-hydroxylating ferredoxin subunit
VPTLVETPINRRLSNWDALNYCPCHRWAFQPSPGRSPEGICWERPDPATGLYIRTWRAKDAGDRRTFEHVGPAQCVTCGWDLTLSPQANIKSMDPREWQQGTIVNTCLAHQGAVVDILPEGVTIEFDGCNLTNVVLRAEHTMLPVGNALGKGKAISPRAVACSHNRVAVQNDGRDWVCRWTASESKPEGSPVQPVDYKASLLEGRNVDPAALPAQPLTPEERAAEQQAHERWKTRAELARGYVANDGWVPCECIAARKADVEAKLGRALSASSAMPEKTCTICGGCGAISPETVAAREKATRAEAELATLRATAEEVSGRGVRQ